MAALDMTHRLQIHDGELRLDGELVGFITAPLHLQATVSELIAIVEDHQPLLERVEEVRDAIAECDPENEEQVKTLEALQAAADVLELGFDIVEVFKKCRDL
jgi:hypothetical protein